MSTETALENLIDTVARLPGLGKRSARRLVLHLLSDKQKRLHPLLQLLQQADATVVACVKCGNLDVKPVCNICASDKRATGVLCVLEQVSDLWAAERAHAFTGRYHVLGGVLSAIEGITPKMLRINMLLQRLQDENIHEVLFALSVTPEAQNTAYYIADAIKETFPQIELSMPARGMPMGSTPQYTDEGTLLTAFSKRQQFL